MGEKLAYSTDKSQSKSISTSASKTTDSRKSGPMKVRLEKKGRRGKTVTVLFQLSFSQEEVPGILKKLRTYFSCGASFKDGEIVIQGDVINRIAPYFAEQGIQVKRSGG